MWTPDVCNKCLIELPGSTTQHTIYSNWNWHCHGPRYCCCCRRRRHTVVVVMAGSAVTYRWQRLYSSFSTEKKWCLCFCSSFFGSPRLMPHWKLGYEGFVNDLTWSPADSIQIHANNWNEWLINIHIFVVCFVVALQRGGMEFRQCNQIVYAKNKRIMSHHSRLLGHRHILYSHCRHRRRHRPEKINKG